MTSFASLVLLFGLAAMSVASSACDLGGLDLGGGGPQDGALPVSAQGRRVQVGFDNDFEVCPGNLARWSADLDAIDQHLLIEASQEISSLFYFEDEEALEDSCSNYTGCYHERPEGPETVELFAELDGRAVYWFVFDRLELGWSVSLPPFLRHGLASGLTGLSCDIGGASLEAVLNKGPIEGLALNESKAAGQWIRLMLQQGGPIYLEEFASKLEGASNEAYIRSVFFEVYGIPMEVTWDDAQSTPLLAPPGGWCRAPSLPRFDGVSHVRETLDCTGSRTQVHGDGSYHVSYSVEVSAPGSLVVSGTLPEGVELTLESCSCESFVVTRQLTVDEPLELDAGTWRLHLRAEEAVQEETDLSLTLTSPEDP